MTDQLIDELTKSDLQVFDSDNKPININYSKFVGELIGHHLQVWKSASVSLSSLLKDAAVLLSELFISDMPAKNLFEVLEIDTMYKFKNNLIIPLLNSGHIEMTYPVNPTSSKQKYRLTGKGRDLFEE